MAVKKSLRKSIDAHCKGCCYDSSAAGTWRAQVTLCPILGCELYDVRPTTNTIPESVIKYYQVTPAEISRLALKTGQEGGFSEHNSVREDHGQCGME